MTKFSQNPNDYSFSIDPVVIAEENVSTNGVRYIQLRTAIINGVPAYRNSNLNPAIAE